MRLVCYNKPILLTFAPPEALNQSKLMLITLREARPSEFVAVPRVYEKFKELIEMRMRDSSVLVHKAYEWAKEKGFGNTLAAL